MALNGDVTNIFVEPSQVRYGASGASAGAEVDLGFTEGGVKISVKDEWVDVTADQTGKTVLDSVQIGTAITLKMSLKEMTVANMRIAFPHGATRGSGFDIGRLPGYKASDGYGRLIIHPAQLAENDKTRDFIVYRALGKIDGDIEFVGDKAKMIPVTFTGYAIVADLEAGKGLASYGDVDA